MNRPLFAIRAFFLIAALLGLPAAGRAGEPNPRGEVAKTMEEAEARMKPFDGKRAPGGADPSTMEGKIVAGYQGWFSTPGDGSGNGWVHWAGKDFKPGNSTVEIWPDMSETTPAEQYPTGFHNPDGSVAPVFSSYNSATVDRHFKWMADYGIDGAFVQRFVGRTRSPGSLDTVNAVLDNCRRAANAHGRTWAVMYDLSGGRKGELPALISKDWKALVDRMQVTKDPSYQHHKGKPLVVLWGVGFSDGRKYTLQECAEVVDFLKNDPKYGGNAVMLGVPTHWRDGTADAVNDPMLQELMAKVDIVSPWNVGRYKNAAGFDGLLDRLGKGDVAWARERKVDYLPVIFPGFSWSNLMRTRGRTTPFDQTPRGDGSFFWKQGQGWIGQGVNMIYVAMFDEVDEGTAIFKTSNHPPDSGETKFVTNGDQPPDQFLWLAGQLGKTLKKQAPPSEELPKRPAGSKP